MNRLDLRSGRADPDADSPGQSVDCLLEGVLSGGFEAVHGRVPAKGHCGLFADLSHPQQRFGRLGRAVDADAQAGWHPTTKQVAPKISQTLQQPHLVADDITVRTKPRLMLALVAQLLPLLEQIAVSEKEMAALFLTPASSQLFASLPGAGKRLAPWRFSEWGDDRKRYAELL